MSLVSKKDRSKLMGNVLWLLWLIVPLASTAENSSESNERMIFDKRFPANGEYPYAVFIINTAATDDVGSCGGSILSLSQIVTAGHCFVKANTIVMYEESVYIVVGGTVDYLQKTKERQLRCIFTIKLHMGFKKMPNGDIINDIALATLNHPFEPSATLSPIKVISKDILQTKNAWYKFVESGKLCTALGWGKTEFDSEKYESIASNRSLKAFHIRPWTDEDCSKGIPRGEDMSGIGDVCLSQLKPEEGIYVGDPGSPLICDGYVFGHSRALIKNETDGKQMYLLYWPYLVYLQIAPKLLHSHAHSIGSHSLPTFFALLLAHAIFLL